jgi:mRNA-degrading endonuclease RelE of RelBE toxin-antitoxin system
MASKFELQYTKYFEKQWLEFNEKTRQLIKDKLKLIKQNPYRYDTLEGYARVRKLKLSVKGKYQRLIYALHMPEVNQVFILGIFPRDKGYQEFERIFGSLKK